MNGAESLVRTLVDGGVNVCFSNPGTSEMHFVAALDRVDGMRCVLGAVRGRGDRRGRRLLRAWPSKPAATLLHLGPASATASPTCTTPARPDAGSSTSSAITRPITASYDAPLTSDIESAARPFSALGAHLAGRDGASPPTAPPRSRPRMTPPGQVATLILPADTAWNEAHGAGRRAGGAAARSRVGEDAIRGSRGAAALRRAGDAAAHRAARCARTGLALAGAHRGQDRRANAWPRPSNRRMERGAGRISIERIPYPVDQALERARRLAPHRAGRRQRARWRSSPIRTSPSVLDAGRLPVRTRWRAPTRIRACARMARRRARRHAQPIGPSRLAPARARRPARSRPRRIAQSLGALIPENAIVVDEGVTDRPRLLPRDAQGASAHLAAEHGRLDRHRHAARDRRGGRLPRSQGRLRSRPTAAAMYTIQALWTQARENLDITTVLSSPTAPTRSCATS